MTPTELFKDDNALAERLRRTFDLGDSALPLRRIGTGFKSVVLGSPAGLVFRVAQNGKAQKGHSREFYILSRPSPCFLLRCRRSWVTARHRKTSHQKGSADHRFYHGDLWHEHIILDPADDTRVAGVIDWEYAGFGDPMLDFVPQMRHGREYMACMLESYQAKGGEFGPDAVTRIELHYPYRELGGLCYCLDIGDEQEARCCVEKFRTVLAAG